MKLAELRTVTLKLEIPNRTLATRLLEAWSVREDIFINILRARVTPDEARYELEIRGVPAAVAKILRECAPWDADRSFLIPAPAGVLA